MDKVKNFISSFFFCFLVVFFANYLLPGVEVTDQTKIPHFGGDLPFAAGLGLLNAIVYPIFKRALSRLAMATIILNFVAYGVIKFLPLGIDMVNFLGYLTACVVVSAGCFIIHFFASRNEVPFNHMHEGM